VLGIAYDGDRNSLLVIGLPDKVKKAKILSELHLKHEAELQILNARKRATEEKLEEERRRVELNYKLEFNVATDLLGLVIGKNGQHVDRVSKLDGVESIKVNRQTGHVLILAKSKEQAEAARAQLEYVEKTMEIPLRLLGYILGLRGKNIRDIQSKSEVFRISVGLSTTPPPYLYHCCSFS
jgi:polyribonucleotide nucleotidyltransferase